MFRRISNPNLNQSYTSIIPSIVMYMDIKYITSNSIGLISDIYMDIKYITSNSIGLISEICSTNSNHIEHISGKSDSFNLFNYKGLNFLNDRYLDFLNNYSANPINNTPLTVFTHQGTEDGCTSVNIAEPSLAIETKTPSSGNEGLDDGCTSVNIVKAKPSLSIETKTLSSGNEGLDAERE